MTSLHPPSTNTVTATPTSVSCSTSQTIQNSETAVESSQPHTGPLYLYRCGKLKARYDAVKNFPSISSSAVQVPSTPDIIVSKDINQDDVIDEKLQLSTSWGVSTWENPPLPVHGKVNKIEYTLLQNHARLEVVFTHTNHSANRHFCIRPRSYPMRKSSFDRELDGLNSKLRINLNHEEPSVPENQNVIIAALLWYLDYICEEFQSEAMWLYNFAISTSRSIDIVYLRQHCRNNIQLLIACFRCYAEHICEEFQEDAMEIYNLSEQLEEHL